MDKTTKIFITTMYRWGNRENHSYIVYAGQDKEYAIKAGIDEKEFRGGKYEPEVILFVPGKENEVIYKLNSDYSNLENVFTCELIKEGNEKTWVVYNEKIGEFSCRGEGKTINKAYNDFIDNLVDLVKVIEHKYNIKKDARKQKDGWAPGNYCNICKLCSCNFIGDKRAIICADCAYKK